MVLKNIEQERLLLMNSALDITQNTQTAEQELVSDLGNMAPFGSTTAHQSIQPSYSSSTYDDLQKRIYELETIIARRDEEKPLTEADKVPTSNNNPGASLSGFGGASKPGHEVGTSDNGVHPPSKAFGSSGFGGLPTPEHGFGASSKPFGSSAFGASSTPAHGFGSSSNPFGSTAFGGPSAPTHAFGSSSKPFGSSGFGSPTIPEDGFGFSQSNLQASSNPFGSSGFGGPLTRDNDSRPFSYGLGLDHQPTQGSNVTGIGTEVNSSPISSPISATEHKPFGTRGYSVALNGSPAFGATLAQAVDHKASVSDKMSTPAPGEKSASASAKTTPIRVDSSDQITSAPAEPSANLANAYLLKALEQLVVKSEGTIPEMKMLEILMQTHAGLVKALELAKIEGRDKAASVQDEIL